MGEAEGAAEDCREEDISGDGGVLKRVLKPGVGEPFAREGTIRASVNYTGALLSGDVFDAGWQAFLVGRGHVIKGWDVGVASMCLKEEAEFTVREDYAYGVAGLPAKEIPPHATLVFKIELLEAAAVEAEAAENGEEQRVPALPPTHAEAERVPDEPRVVEVGGVPVKLDKLGPLIVNTDGTLGRIANWDQMTEREQQNTLRLIGRRNQQRIAALRAEGKDVHL
mmetsp:Transcript_99868/g.311894  ORF Transcript_99868/g.311894 Transcript_99868/m.311894 type:complete len:224 (+) Transcript_99868:1-672(+)